MNTEDSKQDPPELARRIGLFSLIVYGVGDMVGAGIYGMIGVAAGLLGNAVWLAFLVSMGAAMLTGLSYASLGSRYPRAGGAAFITQRAYGFKYLSYVVGLAVTASGITSMAAGSNVFAQTLSNFFGGLPVMPILLGFLAFLALVNWVGIRESMLTNLVCTAVEVGGLLFIVFIGARFWGTVDYLAVPEGSSLSLSLILSGSVLTFYAFVGFEDMLNVAEEVKDPQRNMPRGIIWALIIATLLYLAVSITAVSVVEARQLADPTQGAPLAQIAEKAAPWVPNWVYNAITLFAVANTALLNYIMGTRLLYGMARQKLLPGFLGRVHPRFRTPHYAVATMGIIVAVLALSGTIADLASATSLLLLMCFCLINLALFILQRRAGEPPGRLEIPSWIPLAGAVVCASLIIVRIASAQAGWMAPVLAGGIVVGISLLYLVLRPRQDDLAQG